MLCLFVVNPTGLVPELLIGALLLVTLAGLALDLALYGLGDDDLVETVPPLSQLRRFGEVAAVGVLKAKPIRQCGGDACACLRSFGRERCLRNL